MDTPAYQFSAPGTIVFGWGERRQLPSLIQRRGRRALVLVGSRQLIQLGTLTPLLESCRTTGLSVEEFAVGGREPTIADVDALVDTWRSRGVGAGDVVVTIGGGSTLDLGKAAAALITQSESQSVRAYLEGVGTGAVLCEAPLPHITLPTTAGTGSEATKNAVISVEDPCCKKSLRSEAMIPQVALVDPELTVSVPSAVTAHTGMDAITQLMESYISARCAPLPRALTQQALPGALTALPLAVREGTHPAARTALSHAALCSGMALANSGLGLAHGVAAALGSIIGTPHGLACAVMLAPTLRFNQAVARTSLAELAELVHRRRWPTDSAAVAALIETIAELCTTVGIPQRLRDLGVTREHIPALVAGSRGNSLNGNPRPVDATELHDLLESLW
jgi:alcohol dehydrogenase class IV